LITAEEKKVTFATTDLEVSVKCSIPAEVSEPGITTLPVRRLSSIVRELPDSAIEIETDDKDVATVTCGASFFKIIGMASDEFPPVPEKEGEYCYHLDQGIFREMLKKTAYAASTDEARFVLNGVLLSFKDEKLTMVATDGRRLALVENEVEIPPESEKDLILPSKAVNELVHVLKDEGELRVYPKENQIMFEFNDVMMASKLIDGTYPNFRQVIPAECEERVIIEREVLLTALKRASLITVDNASASKLTFDDNQLVVSTNTPDVGEARESIPIKYSGKKITVAFNPEYMMDPLKNLSNDEIAIELTDDLSPGVIKCDIPFLYVLMPMRVD
ncbi:DNA polymerase III subunit beta, partial [PVC group bacterium]|nr:DNA polymerase III subunit beta [PVC group bacterium]